METLGLDEVLLTFGQHQATVNHAEVVEQGCIQVGFPACVGRAAGIVLPGAALKVEEAAKGVLGWWGVKAGG